MICTWSTKVFTIAQVVRAFHLHCLCFLIYKPSKNWLFVKLQTAHVELVSVHCFVLTLNCFIIQRFFKSCRGELGLLWNHKHGANDPALCEHNKSLFFSQMNPAPTHKLGQAISKYGQGNLSIKHINHLYFVWFHMENTQVPFPIASGRLLFPHFMNHARNIFKSTIF